MGNLTKLSDTDRIDAAFNRVLAAEAQARAQVEACRHQAAALIAAAEQQARSIVERTDQRIRLAHTIADARVAHALRALLPEGAPATQDAAQEIASGLDAAIEILVDEALGRPTRGPR
jgi:GAF domain-containing protein